MPTKIWKIIKNNTFGNSSIDFLNFFKEMARHYTLKLISITVILLLKDAVF